MHKQQAVWRGWALLALLALALTGVPQQTLAGRKPLEGSVNETLTGPAGKG